VQLEKIFVSPTWRDLALYACSKTQEPHVRERRQNPRGGMREKVPLFI
jgi:hypothetical protein